MDIKLQILIIGCLFALLCVFVILNMKKISEKEMIEWMKLLI